MEMENHDDLAQIRKYKDRIRIFLILYYFSEPYSDPNTPTYIKQLTSEIKIQKIDFLIRNPDYLSYILLKEAEENEKKKPEIKTIVEQIFKNNEPKLRRLEMERFFFGAYEDIDDVIAFLKSIGFIEFKSKKNIKLNTYEKQYFVTRLAIDNIEKNLGKLESLKWYTERCLLIKKYFGDLSGSQLKVAQYKIDSYRETTFKNYIKGISESVTNKFMELYSEELR